jgi:hypothetical protein
MRSERYVVVKRRVRAMPALRRGLIAAGVAIALATGITGLAPVAQAGVPGCAWQPLTLVNGWQSEQGAFGTGDPSFCADGDEMVYVSGSVAAPGGSTGEEFAVLPAGYAPAHYDYFTVYTNNGAVGVVQISPTGIMSAYGGNAQQFTSLAGISFPANAAGVQGLMPLLAGWQSAQSAYLTGNPGYFINNGVAHLDGSVYHPNGTPQWGSDTAWTFAQLPAAATPSHCMTINTYTFDGGSNDLFIDQTNGAIHGASAQYTSLAGISYPVGANAWQPLSLVNSAGWPCDPVDSSLGYGVVYLTGGVEVPYEYSGEFAVLPPGQRPAHTLYLNVNGTGIGSNDWANLRIDADGEMSIFNLGGYPPNGGSPGSALFSLDGLSFRVNS